MGRCICAFPAVRCLSLLDGLSHQRAVSLFTSAITAPLQMIGAAATLVTGAVFNATSIMMGNSSMLFNARSVLNTGAYALRIALMMPFTGTLTLDQTSSVTFLV